MTMRTRSHLHLGQKTHSTGLAKCASRALIVAMADITHLEEQIAHLTRTVEELSDILARQETELAAIQRRLAVLMEREAGRELEAGGTVPLADQRPPHW